MSVFVEARLRAGIVNAIEAIEDGDLGYAVAILHALDDGPRSRRGAAIVCPHCSLCFAWPGLLDHHLRFSHADALADDLEIELAGALSRIGDDEPRVCLDNAA